jgi:hypothetical protein
LPDRPEGCFAQRVPDLFFSLQANVKPQAAKKCLPTRCRHGYNAKVDKGTRAGQAATRTPGLRSRGAGYFVFSPQTGVEARPGWCGLVSDVSPTGPAGWFPRTSTGSALTLSTVGAACYASAVRKLIMLCSLWQWSASSPDRGLFQNLPFLPTLHQSQA